LTQRHKKKVGTKINLDCLGVNNISMAQTEQRKKKGTVRGD